MFETVLAGHPVPRRSALAGPLSFALHAAAVAAVVIGSAWRISDPGEPNVPIVFLATNPPPPQGAAAPAAARAHAPDAPAGAKTAVTVPRLVAPSTIPVDIGSAPEPAPVDLLPGAGRTDAGPGSPEGVEGGTGDPALPGSAGGGPPISATAPNVVPPRLLLQAQPEYPETARRIREQGVVVLQAVIGTGGGVEDVQVLSSTSPLFDDAAIRAVRQWRYAPATLDRRSVRVYLTVTIHFTLH